ncbi:MAG TPA: phenylalanine--tRNA ligase subunit beta, partial [Minicystis sp.]|nr:phenylalanine--tRNA ligase subunit beta [Minicystis sp.]
KDGEKLETLDGVTRTLSSDDLVICDAEGPVALAGVMGGAGSEIGPSTKRVLLECAYFQPRGIRRSSRRHALHTESSHRFERGVDPADIPDVLAHAASLLTQLAGGAGVPGILLAGVEVAHPSPITLRARRIDALLGAHVPFDEATRVLGALGFKVAAAREDAEAGAVAEVTPPTHRPDVQGEADLVEEVMRVRGIASIPTVIPAIKPQPPRTTGALENRVRRAAIELGLSEALAFGFVSPRQIAALGLPPAPVTLQNPLGEERSAMRTTLLPGLLDAVARARRHGVLDARLFQVGARFLAPNPNVVAGAAFEKAVGLHSGLLPYEARSFAAVIAGRRDAVLEKPEDVDVYDAKGIACAVVQRVLHRAPSVRPQPPERRAPYLHPRAAGELLVGEAIVGVFGTLHPDVADLSGVEGPVVLIELDLDALDAIGAETPRYRPIPVLPAATRDIALVVSEDVPAGSVGDEIRAAAGEVCESVELFDLFRGAGIPDGHRSLAFHVVYRDPRAATDPEHAKTLTDQEVDARHAAVVRAVSSKFGAQLRA